MARIVAVLSAFPGVTGVCLLHPGQEPLAEGTGLQADQLHQLAMQAAILFRLGSAGELATHCVKLKFARHGIVALANDAGAILLLACEPRANTALIANVARKMFPVQAA